MSKSDIIEFPTISSRWDFTKSGAKLKELEDVVKGAGRRRVLVLCHNNPDPDSIGGAYGLSFLLNKKFGVKSTIGFGGVVTRAENQAMINRLRIKVTQMRKIKLAQYYGVALMDAQPGTGNNLIGPKDPAPLIVVDHHPLRRASLRADFHDIRPNYGATSTIVTEYLLAAGLKPSKSVANALLYGIKADTNSLGRGSAKTDFYAFNFLSTLSNPKVIGWIERPALTAEYLADYQHGLVNTLIYREVAVADLGRIHSEAIIPELADLLLRLENVCWSFCMGEYNKQLIISVRSSSRTHSAGAVIRRIVGKVGSAGGHREMAGGQVPLCGLDELGIRDVKQKLIHKLLKTINKECVHPKPLIHGHETPEPARGNPRL